MREWLKELIVRACDMTNGEWCDPESIEAAGALEQARQHDGAEAVLIGLLIERVERLQAAVVAERAIRDWYEEDHDRHNRDDEDVSDDLLELERAAEAAKEGT